MSGRYLGLYNSIYSWIQVVILLKGTQVDITSLYGSMHDIGCSCLCLGLYGSLFDALNLFLSFVILLGARDKEMRFQACMVAFFSAHMPAVSILKRGNIKLLLPPLALNRSQDKFRRVANNMDLVLYYGYNISLFTLVNAFISF